MTILESQTALRHFESQTMPGRMRELLYRTRSTDFKRPRAPDTRAANGRRHPELRRADGQFMYGKWEDTDVLPLLDEDPVNLGVHPPPVHIMIGDVGKPHFPQEDRAWVI